MDPVTTVCEYCNGSRYSEEALGYKYKGLTIEEVLSLSVEDALDFFKDNRKITKNLKALMEVGLPYISLGQPLSSFSGGERQRVKLAQNIGRRGNIYILDEPTTGLHFADVQKLVKIMHKLVEQGNTVVVIEHNLDVIKTGDYIIDMGPEGGSGGGTVVVQGTPEEVAKCKKSYTGAYIKKMLK